MQVMSSQLEMCTLRRLSMPEVGISGALLGFELAAAAVAHSGSAGVLLALDNLSVEMFA